jgi:hypothetical protein
MDRSFTVTSSNADWSGKVSPSWVWAVSIFIAFNNHPTLLVFELPNEIWSVGITLWWICFWVLSPPRRKQSYLSMGSPFGEAACKLKLFAWRYRFLRWTEGLALCIGLHCSSVASNDNAHKFPATQLASNFSIPAMQTFWVSRFACNFATKTTHLNATVLSITMLAFLF